MTELGSQMSNLNTLRQLSFLIANPSKSTLLSNVSKHAETYDEIEKKLVFIATQLLHTTNTRQIHDMMFR